VPLHRLNQILLARIAQRQRLVECEQLKMIMMHAMPERRLGARISLELLVIFRLSRARRRAHHRAPRRPFPKTIRPRLNLVNHPVNHRINHRRIRILHHQYQLPRLRGHTAPAHRRRNILPILRIFRGNGHVRFERVAPHVDRLLPARFRGRHLIVRRTNISKHIPKQRLGLFHRCSHD